MLAILHHVDQHRLGDPGLVVGLSVHIEVTEAGTPEGTDLAVERFHAPVDILMFLQLLTRVELLLTQLALLCLEADRVFPVGDISRLSSHCISREPRSNEYFHQLSYAIRNRLKAPWIFMP